MRTSAWVTLVVVTATGLLQQSAVAARHIQIASCPYKANLAREPLKNSPIHRLSV